MGHVVVDLRHHFQDGYISRNVDISILCIRNSDAQIGESNFHVYENIFSASIGFMPPDIISSNSVSIIPNATLYYFGVLTSNVHMSWLRTIGGRLKSGYRYTGSIVYNTFPWCNPDEKQKALIEKTAQAILDARKKYPDCSLADLYDETTMPPELRKAHQANDKAVMLAYGFDYKTMTESECVAELMKMYQKLTSAN